MAHVQQRAMLSAFFMPVGSVHPRIFSSGGLREEFRLPDGKLLLAALPSPVQQRHQRRLPVVQRVQPLHGLGVLGSLRREQPLQWRSSVYRRQLQRVHLEQPVRSRSGVCLRGLRSVHRGQSMWTERPVHRDAHALSLHLLDE